MAIGQGASSKAALKIEKTTQYGTSIAVDGASEKNQIHILSESIINQPINQSSDFLDGQSGKRNIFKTLEKISGDVETELHYDGELNLLAICFGQTRKMSSPISLGSNAYEHIIEPSKLLATEAENYYDSKTPSGNKTRRATICFDKSVSIWEAVSSMISSFELDVKPEKVVAKFSIVSNSLNRDSSNNNTSTNWSLPQGNQVLFSDSTLYLKAKDKFTISASNNQLVINESSNVTISMAAGTYTGAELSSEIATKLNNNSTLNGKYNSRYDSNERKFVIFTTNNVSFKILGANASSTISKVIGMTTDDTVSSTKRWSNKYTTRDKHSAFSSSDSIGFSSLNIKIENSLSDSDQDSQSGLKIIEPERNSLRNVSGSITIPRYKNNLFIEAVNGDTEFEMKLVFTGSSIGASNEKFEINIPSLKFEKASAPISGASIIKQNLTFKAAFPNELDFSNFFDTKYFIEEDIINNADLGTVISALEIYKDGLYFGSSGNLQSFNKTDGTSGALHTLASGNITSLKSYLSDLFIGDSTGKVNIYTGSGVSLSCDFSISSGGGSIVSFVNYEGSLYCISSSTGKLFKYDGSSSWSLVYDSTLVEVYDMIVYNGLIYILGNDGVNNQVHKYNGTTGSLDQSISSLVNGQGNFFIHEGILMAAIDDKIYELFSTWVNLSASANATGYKFAFSFMGNILIFESGSPYKVNRFNLVDGTETLIFTGTGALSEALPKLYENKMFYADSVSLAAFFEINEIFLKIINQTASNPL